MSSPAVVSRAGQVFLAVILTAVLWPAVVRAQLPSTGGHPVSNPEWQILPTDWGYADLAFDLRPGFSGREYLSGEWAAAVHYTGGQNPTNAIWFQPQWFFPDWVSDSNFGVQTNFISTGTVNANGFTVYESVITNKDIRITINYEMLDSTNGIAMGMTKKSAGPDGTQTQSSRYVFHQTYRIMNIALNGLSNFKFYQFLHACRRRFRFTTTAFTPAR